MGRQSLVGGGGTNMLAKDQTRLRIEKMEAEREQRRINAAASRIRRAEEEKRSLAAGNPGDVDFIGLVRQWREDHSGLATKHDNCSDTHKQISNGDSNKICVCVRKRPLNSKELNKKEHDAVTCLHPTATVHSAKIRVDGISKYCDHNTFKFDHAFDETSSTEDVYTYTAKPLVQYVCEGKGSITPRATVFAYGQTGSGKTHTMSGIQTLVADEIFATLNNNSFDNVGVSLAIFEIYGGRIQDLLNERNRLKVLEDGKGEVVVAGLKEFEASSPSDFLSLIEEGHNNRTTHATEANDVSSRSHAICQVLLRDKKTGKMKGKLSLVDLAGSERGTDTKSHNRQRRTESSDINTSLLALKECIRAIDSDSKHVPYRQSKLTLILKDCFVSKSARTAVISTLSPGSTSTDHTINTLRYADRIKEREVGTAFASTNNRSPTRPLPVTRPSKKSPVRKAPPPPPPPPPPEPIIQDDRDELDELMDTTDEQTVEVDDPKKQSEIDETVKKLFEEEEQLLNLHMQAIHENAELLTEEGGLLQMVQGEDYDIDHYAERLGEILERKTFLIHSVRERLSSFTTLLKKEEELALAS